MVGCHTILQNEIQLAVQGISYANITPTLIIYDIPTRMGISCAPSALFAHFRSERFARS